MHGPSRTEEEVVCSVQPLRPYEPDYPEVAAPAAERVATPDVKRWGSQARRNGFVSTRDDGLGELRRLEGISLKRASPAC